MGRTSDLFDAFFEINELWHDGKASAKDREMLREAIAKFEGDFGAVDKQNLMQERINLIKRYVFPPAT